MWATPASPAARTPRPAISTPSTSIRPLVGARIPVIACTSSAWPFAVDAGEGDDLAGAHRKRRAADRLETAVVEHAQILDGQDRALWRVGLLLYPEDHVAPDHHTGERLLGGAGARNCAHRLAAAQHGDAVGDLEHLAELVRDEDDRRAVLPQSSQDRHQLGDLLRREHGGRLVEHEDARVAIERAEDLDALLHADRDVLDAGARVDREPVAVRELLHAFACRAAVKDADRSRGTGLDRLVAEHDVLETVMTGMNMKCWCTMPIPRSIASFGEWILTGLPSTRISPDVGL